MPWATANKLRISLVVKPRFEYSSMFSQSFTTHTATLLLGCFGKYHIITTFYLEIVTFFLIISTLLSHNYDFIVSYFRLYYLGILAFYLFFFFFTFYLRISSFISSFLLVIFIIMAYQFFFFPWRKWASIGWGECVHFLTLQITVRFLARSLHE